MGKKYLTFDYQRYEYTNNMLYEFFKRTLKNQQKIEDFEYVPIVQHTLKIKDVILFENNEIKFTLQDVIYNAYPELYKIHLNDGEFKEDINYSMDIKKFKDYIGINKEGEKSAFNTVIYKDLIQNKYIELTEEALLQKIEETILYEKINVRYSEEQLNIEECNFINIYDLNINLPDEELLDYLLMIKANHKKVITKSIDKEFNELRDEEKSKIKRYITFKNKKLLTKKNSKRNLEFTRESVSLFNEFLEADKIKKINESKIEEKTLKKEYQCYKDLEQENFERIQKENKKKNLKYKSYIYDPQKLAHILFVYDLMQTKLKNDTYDEIMKRIQYSILYHRREFIEIIDIDDLEDEDACGLSKSDSSKVKELLMEIHSIITLLDNEYDRTVLKEIEEENIYDINILMKKIHSIIGEANKKRFLPYLPYISIRTLYKYYEIAKFYIDEKGYKLLLD